MSTAPPPRRFAVGKPNWLYYPSLESSDADVRGFMDRQIQPLSHLRRYHTQRAALNLWFYLGRQWIEARTQLAPGNGAYHFSEIFRNSQAAFPRPVTNIIAPTVDNEVSRLGRKELVPDTSPSKNKPEWKAAAKLGKEILVWEMAKEIWPDKREELYTNFCLESVAILRTSWDENDLEKTLVASPETARCPHCKRKFASRKVPRAFQSLGMPDGEEPREMMHSGTLRDVPPSGEGTAEQHAKMAQVEMSKCPFCEDETELEGYSVTEEEAGGTDVFDRPMGLLVPRGSGAIDPISIHEYYPDNGGIQYEPREQACFHSMTARSLEWLALRYPEFGDDLRPEAPQNLMRLNPLYAEPTLTNSVGGGLSTGSESFANHARLQETIILPQPHIPGLERGAIFHRLADGVKVIRKELMVEVEGDDGKFKYVPRTKYHFARFKRIPKNFWGRTFVDDLIPVQRRLNELDAQVIDLRERGKPTMYLPKGTTIFNREDDEGSMVHTEYDSPNPEWRPADGIFPGVPITGNPYFQERGQIMEDAQRIGFPQDIEVGQAPGSVKTTSGLMLISEEASQKRAPRERSLALMFESAFTHILQMNWAFRKEDEDYEVLSAAGTYERKSFTGTDLIGDIRVKVDARAGYDQTLYNKEAAGEAMDRGLYVVTGPDSRDKILDLMKLPKDVNEGDSIQVGRAELAWSDFMNMDKVPDPDYTAWEFPVWHPIFLKRWMGDEAKKRQDDAGFDGIWTELVTWEAKLALFEQMEMEAEPYREVPPEQWAEVYQQGQAMVEEAKQTYDLAMVTFSKVSQSSMGAGTAPPMPPPPPPMEQFPEPPKQPFLPDALHLKIYAVWQRMNPQLQAGLEAAKTVEEIDIPGQGSEAMLDLDLLLRMRAVIEACRMLAMPPPMPMGPPGAEAGMGPSAPPM